jgi:transcriptional regulator with XRE-family HTH domain
MSHAHQIPGVSTRERPIDRGHRLATADIAKAGHEIRAARETIGKSLESVGRSSGISPSQVGRIERGSLRTVSVDQLARVGASVGLDIRVRAYPGPDPVLEAGQVALLGRLRVRLHPDLGFRTEVPLPIQGDQRAWDGFIDRLTGVASNIPVEADTRLVDGQGQLRRVMIKLRDSGLEHVLLVLADTRSNREALAATASTFAVDFPVSPRRALAALAAGEHPGGSALLLL